MSETFIVPEGKKVQRVRGEGTLDVNVVSGTITGGGDGAIFDGVDNNIKATVLDYTNSNPVAVRLTDTNGDYVSAGGGTEYTEDAVAPADPVGKAIVATRDDQLATVTEAEGDWSRLRSSAKGALWVTIPDVNGDPITSFGGGTQYTEGDIDASITGTASLGEAPSNTLQPLQLDASNNLKVAVQNATIAVTQSGTWDEVGINDSGNSITVDDGGTSLTVDGTVSVSGSVDTELPTAAALADNTSNPTVPAVGSFGMIYDGSTWDRTPGNSTDGTLVNLGANNDVTVTGTVTANLAAGTNNIGDVDVLSVPAPLSTTGGGTEATALRVTVASDSTGVLSVDDNGSSLTVDGTVAATQSGAWNITNISGTVSLPTGAATETSLAKLTQSATIAQASTNISTTAQIVASNASRKKILIKNPVDAADILYIGDSGVTTGNGFPLLQGESIMLDTTAAVHGVAGSGTIAVKTIEFT